MTVFLTSGLITYEQSVEASISETKQKIHSCLVNFTDEDKDLFTPEGFELLHQLLAKKFQEENHGTMVKDVLMIAVSNLGNKMLPQEKECLSK